MLFLAAAATGGAQRFSPVAVATGADGKTLYIAQADPAQIAVFDTAAERVVRTMPLAAPASEPTGLALSPDGARLYVTCVAAGRGSVAVIGATNGKVIATFAAGHGACAPAVSADDRTLFVCNRFDNDVSFIATDSGSELARVPAVREPVAAALTPNAPQRLVVANHLPAGAANAATVAARVSVIDTAARKTVAEIELPSGSMNLRGVCVSPDGHFAYVTHLLGRFHMPTTQLDRGWMNTNALSVIDLASRKRFNTVLLDNVDVGAANPWGVACSADGRFVAVTHAGTGELSVIDAPALLAKLRRLEEAPPAPAAALSTGSAESAPTSYGQVSRVPDDAPYDLAFLVGIRRRLRLAGAGPRALALSGTRAYAAECFSGTLGVIDLESTSAAARSIALGGAPDESLARRGERLFNDASLCFQGWQSCASCHPDGRADGLNWDLMNDGLGNPKNTRSLLLSHQTPPVMAMGVRADAETAVRSGIKFIQFAVRPEAEAAAIDEYLKAMAPAPSPRLVNGALSAPAERGKALFFDEKIGCGHCHSGPNYTNGKMYDVGTAGDLDREGREYDTPTLIEVWRTAPYLHDGRSATIGDLLTRDNAGDKHGVTSHLGKDAIDDLAEFVLSL